MTKFLKSAGNVAKQLLALLADASSVQTAAAAVGVLVEIVQPFGLKIDALAATSSLVGIGVAAKMLEKQFAAKTAPAAPAPAATAPAAPVASQSPQPKS